MHFYQLVPLLPFLPLATASGGGGGGGGHFITPSSPFPLSKRDTCSKVLSPSYQSPVIGSGWVAQIIANSLTLPRSLVFDSSGGMLVLEQKKGITRLTFTSENDDDSTSTTCMIEQSREAVVEDEELLHGLSLSNDGTKLYASTSDKVYMWPYDAEAGTVSEGERKTLIQGMASGGHVTRTILLLEGEGDLADKLLVSRGSDGNIDIQTRDIESGVSQIRAFDLGAMASDTEARAYTQGEVLGWGLRNSVGLTQDPVTGGIWSVENSADNMKRLGEDIHDDNPGEELNFHGYLNGSETEGRNFGYPDCFALWDKDGFPEIGDMTVGSQFANEGSEKTDEQCKSDTQAPRLTFQAHTAPLDVLVPGAEGVVGRTTADETKEEGEREMYITFHGSWNRPSPVGYSVVSVALDGKTGQPLAEASSAEAAVLVMGNPDLSECPGGCFRPVGMAMDNERRLFVASDKTGEVFVLKKADFSAGTLPGGSGDGELVGEDGDDDSAGTGVVSGIKDKGGLAVVVGCSSLAALALGGFLGAW